MCIIMAREHIWMARQKEEREVRNEEKDKKKKKKVDFNFRNQEAS